MNLTSTIPSSLFGLYLMSESKLQDTTRTRDITNTPRWESHVRVIRHTFVSMFRGKNEKRKTTLVSNDVPFCVYEKLSSRGDT